MLLGDKWALRVLGTVSRGGVLRYKQIQRAIPGISQRMLTLTLKTLEENGFVTRTSFATVPPRVDYQLTPLGESLRVPLAALREWARTHGAEMAAARRAYATRPGGAARRRAEATG